MSKQEKQGEFRFNRVPREIPEFKPEKSVEKPAEVVPSVGVPKRTLTPEEQAEIDMIKKREQEVEENIIDRNPYARR
ncbi:MAG: hypothetical protein WCT44_02175 [Candidatus Paceibacterota bacterium]